MPTAPAEAGSAAVGPDPGRTAATRPPSSWVDVSPVIDGDGLCDRAVVVLGNESDGIPYEALSTLDTVVENYVPPSLNSATVCQESGSGTPAISRTDSTPARIGSWETTASAAWVKRCLGAS